MPKDYRVSFKEWADKYGEIVNLKVFGKNVILLNSKRAINELLDKRTASSYARQKLMMAHELCGLKYMASQVSDPVLHRQYRRIFSTVFNPRASRAFWSLQTTEIRRLALKLLGSTSGYVADIDRCAASIAFLIAYGYDIEREDPALVTKIQRFMKVMLKLISPGAFLVDIIPSLQKLPAGFPGTKFREEAAEYRQLADDVIETPFQRVKHDLANGKAAPSFTVTLLEGADGKTTDETTIKWTAGGIYNAGSDTTAAAIHNFLLAMLMFPDVQAKAQSEMDAVIGRDHVPTIEDREQLPYCWALVLESLRWQPVSPLALPHVMVADEAYAGYLIPKGSTVLANVWLIARDETEFPSPDEFKPERFLSNGKLSLDAEGRGPSFGFGFGRRVCPGAYVAEASLFAAAVTILWSSVVSIPQGSPKTFDPGYPKKPAVHRPGNFPIQVKPRFAGAAEMLHNSIPE